MSASVPAGGCHGQILETFEALAPRAGFDLVNDHDPRALYYQSAAERARTFTWDYLEKGRELWRIRIGRAVTSAAKGGASS